MASQGLRADIEEYLLAGRQKGWSAGTVTRYAWQLQRWCAWLEERQAAHTAPSER